MKCIYCNSTKVRKRGRRPRQRWQCLDKKHPVDVSRYFYEEKTTANVLLFDIETLPMWVRAWRLGEENWSIENIVHDWMVLSYAAKWLFHPKHVGSILTPKEIAARNDKRIIEELHDLLTQADVVIAHNGRAFDVGKINSRFLEYDLAPPSPYKLVDTYETAKRAMGFTSNSLDFLAWKLGVGRKHPTEYDLWVRCENGDKDALDYMFRYNCKDIYLLEDVYVKLRPWIKHPNMSLYVNVEKGEHVCGKCQSDDLDLAGSYLTDASIFDAYQCNNCGAWTRHKSKHALGSSDSRNI